MYEMSVLLQDMRNSKGAAFDLSDRVQRARAFLYACKQLGVDVMSMYGVTAHLAEGKSLAAGYEWFGEFVDELVHEKRMVFLERDARSFKALMDEHKAAAKASKASAPKTQVVAGHKPADAHPNTTVRMSITPSGKVTLDTGKGKSALKASTKGRIADLAAAIKQMSAEEREYLQSLLA